ncbi:hypothetical protein CCHR01_15476 [Colletotrichum chrysophilum]|uniref:Uncharacterized protein n=2 Tax=Colletotrichum TaxID=5455 RepID=A0AAD9AAF6_9PEZI|nr:hypothetical protein CCHR01_15476 [Colletotrichum chrysophilum]
MMSLTNPPSVASGPSSVRTGTLKRSVQAAFEGEFGCLLVLHSSYPPSLTLPYLIHKRTFRVCVRPLPRVGLL